ncbi:PKD domain-containing protein [Haloglomus litoreum]|uniref:PKD domain-containing protein n=1 Tax=Haloglomus litoreum TaxID=3034026 RepID=UPI0023E75563|nr:PKD domain-containing protein [Haloglomus sp. DT116]
MADVTAGRSRAQLLVLAGVLLGLLFVALAVILNGVIFSENLASREENPGGTGTDLRTSVTESATSLVSQVNHADRYRSASYGTLYGNAYTAGLNGIARRIRDQAADRGQGVSLDPISGREGTRLVQDTDGTFEPRAAPPSTPLATSDPNWQVVADAAVRNARLTVERGSLADRSVTELQSELEGGSGGTPFYLRVEDPSGAAWEVGLAHEPATGAVLVDVFDGSTHRTCRLDGSRVTVDIARETLLAGGTAVGCPALDFLGDASGTVDVYYVNGASVTGQYEWIVDRVEPSVRAAVDAGNGFGCTTPTTYGAGASEDPYTEPAIYATTVDLQATGGDSSYDTRLRIAPGDRMGPSTAPRVTAFTVDDTSPSGPDGDSASFDVSWRVADPDGNLDSVTVSVENRDQVGEDGSTTTTVSGASASGSYTSYEGSSGTAGDDYRIVVRVDDGTETRRVVTVEPADGTDGCGGSTNGAPTARFDPPANPEVGQTVSFDASASDDSDGSIVEYRWDFDGDGTVESTTTSATASHSYASAGEYDAELTVVDDDGATAAVTEAVDVTAGSGSPPVVETSGTGIRQDRSKQTGNGETAEFRVEWTVSDPDDDLERVEITLYRDGDTGASYVDRTTINRVSGSGSGSSGGSGTTVAWSSDGAYGEQYDIRVEVVDQAGNVDSLLLEQVADGDDET